MRKFYRAISRVRWLSGEQTSVSKTISVLVLRVRLGRLIARQNFIIVCPYVKYLKLLDFHEMLYWICTLKTNQRHGTVFLEKLIAFS
jgi:hypothetical protein